MYLPIHKAKLRVPLFPLIGINEMAAKCNPAVEEVEDKLVYRFPQHLEPDSPSHTYIAHRHCHIVSGPPIPLQTTDQFPLQFPQQHRLRPQFQDRHQTGQWQHQSPHLTLPLILSPSLFRWRESFWHFHLALRQPAGWPIACRPRRRIGILQRASLAPAIP